MIEKTKQVSKVVLRDNVLKKVTHAELYKVFRENVEAKYTELKNNFFKADWIAFSVNDQKGYWNKKKNIAIPYFSTYSEYKDKYFDIERTELDKKTVEDLFSKNCPDEIVNAIKSSRAFSKGHWIGFGNYSYCIETGQFVNWNDGYSAKVGAVKITASDFKTRILTGKYTILTDDTLKQAVEIINNKSISEISEEGIEKLIKILKIDREKTVKDINNKIKNNFVMSAEIANLFTDTLLSCDKSRANLENYDKKCIEDVNAGHWELWSRGKPEAEEKQVLVSLEKPLIARNPLIDIRNNGLIGIDFGTKSTIVSERDGKNRTSLMRVGTGNLTKEIVSSHYENPTIMEFINLEKFLSDYATKNGRPETSIDDLRVSHYANSDLKSCTVSDEFYSYFYDIKQWCGDTERNVKIIDKKGIERVLPAFVSLKDEEFNPLELYAYYLGLYINNMRNGIYLDYILSFPVTYEKSVKEKILESFTKGLKKSLPEAVLNDEETMKKFRVRQGVSEPAAYAITALQGYGFEPEEDENILYAIFDFGGGTTDFDFGLWRIADDSKRDEEIYDYVIEHFGSEGDKYLGGENLLELLAFEVFKANIKNLGKQTIQAEKPDKKADETPDKKPIQTAGFSFSKPKECDKFAGSEMFISDSQEARRNTKQLMEALRPFWEGIIDIADEKPEDIQQADGKNEAKADENKEQKGKSTKLYNGYIFKNTEDCKFPITDDSYILVNLFDKDGKQVMNHKLYIKNDKQGINVDLIKILEDRIERGVANFFTSIVHAFRNKSAVESGADSIQIFLAGNSSKSPILKKIFNRYIEKATAERSQKKDDGYYHLFPPLGTKEAIAIQREKGIKADENDITAPTGKTGVAYGLISGRTGGKIKVISEVKADEQTKFRYNIGIEKRGKFVVKLDRNKVNYGEWVRFINASSEDFEIYYTSALSNGKLSVNDTGVYNYRCRLETADENADIYIRCVDDSPNDIEYCVSADMPEGDVEVTRIHLED